jgi:hypothetical protein
LSRCSLIHKIEKAFANAECPGESNLTDSTYGEEPAELVEAFRNKHNWKALEPAFLDQAPGEWGSALSFFSAEALRFYLPAYLIADIRGALKRSDPATRLCTFLTPQMENRKIARVWGGGTMGEHARNEFECFDSAQVSAIVSYLWWKLESEGYNPTIEQALENYWIEREAGNNNGI